MSPEVLRGADAAGVPRAARLDVDLRRSRLARQIGPGTTSVDPSLERAVEAVASQAREEARAEGYAAGWGVGARAAREEARAEAEREREQAARARATREEAFSRALAALGQAADQLQSRAAPTVEQAAAGLAEVAFALVERILGRELELAREPGRDAVARALAAVPAGLPVTVRLHPTDAESVGELSGDGRVTVIADPAVEPGGALAECGAMHVDAQLSTALARVREVLAP